jgi:hypothetical protein
MNDILLGIATAISSLFVALLTWGVIDDKKNVRETPTWLVVVTGFFGLYAASGTYALCGLYCPPLLPIFSRLRTMNFDNLPIMHYVLNTLIVVLTGVLASAGAAGGAKLIMYANRQYIQMKDDRRAGQIKSFGDEAMLISARGKKMQAEVDFLAITTDSKEKAKKAKDPNLASAMIPSPSEKIKS